MRNVTTAALLAALALAPSGIAAQGIGLGAHVGLSGFGGDVGFGLSPRVVLRGGLSIAPTDYFLTGLLPSDISGVAYDVILPRTTLRAGLDLQVAGPLRVMAGLMYRTDDLATRARVSGGIDLGNSTFAQTGTVEARLDQRNLMPYVGLGFGRLTAAGFGVYMDVGVAYSGDADIVMTASGDLASAPGIEEALQAEADQYFEDAPTVLKRLYPMLQVGVKLGLGH